MKKAAFIFDGVNHPMKDCFLKEFRKQFPEWDIEVINILEIIKNRKGVIFINLFFILKEYFFHYLFGSKSLKYYFMRTTYIFKKVRRLVSEITLRENYKFTIQMCFLFDGSTPGISHYVYTDIVHLEYDKFPYYNKWHQNSEKWVKLEKEIYDNAEKVFVWSTNIKQTLIEKYETPADKIELIYAGSNINGNFESPFNANKYSSKNILFVGVDWERKGGPQLVEAFNEVLRKIPDAGLTIVGCSPKIDLPNCTVTGKLPPEKVGKFFNEAAVFCMPTLCEPFGIAYIEAFRFKLPVIATNLGAVPDFVIEGKTGFKVEPYDTKQLSEKIIELIENPELCMELGKNGYDLTNEKYDWAVVAQKLKKFILQDIS